MPAHKYSSNNMCPVCGSYEVVRFVEVSNGSVLFLCRCKECNCTGDFFGINDAVGDAIAEWRKLPE